MQSSLRCENNCRRLKNYKTSLSHVIEFFRYFFNVFNPKNNSPLNVSPFASRKCVVT